MDRIGRYLILRALGSGGMGAVYLARDPSLERDVALKLLHPGAPADLRAEAKTLAQLSHPHIVTIFEVGEHAGEAGPQQYLTMEFLPGQTLRQVLSAGAPEPRLLAICAKVASALEAAHRARILHRDIKPENVIVGAHDEVKVVDFGIARRLDVAAQPRPRATSAHEVVDAMRPTAPQVAPMWGLDTEVSPSTQTAFGTPAYMAPEVLLGEPSEPASDVYSLGVTLYECVAGRRPYSASSLVEIISQIIDQDPPPLDHPLGGLVARMLSRARQERPGLAEVIAALVDATALPPAPPPSPVVVHMIASQPVTRRRWPWFALAGCVVAGLGAAAWTLTRPSAAVPPALVTTTVGVEVLAVTIPSYGGEPPSPELVTDVLARLLHEMEGVQLTTFGVPAAEAANGSPAPVLVRGGIVERDGALHGELDVVDGPSRRVLAHVSEARPSGQLAALLSALAERTAQAIAPGAAVSPSPGPRRARDFVQVGTPLLENGEFTAARPYFEQAVFADPAYFAAWYGYAGILAWMQAPDAATLAATDRALALAPAGAEHELVSGVAAFLHHDFAGARVILTPLDRATPPGPPWTRSDQRDLLYYLGEAAWHDGDFTGGWTYFKRTLEREPRFRPASVHAWQYPVARRDADAARYYIGLAGESAQWLEFALGHYEDLAAHGTGGFRLSAQLVLGQSPSPDAEPVGDDLVARTYRIARATGAGDRTAAQHELEGVWALLADRSPAHVGPLLFGIEALGDVLLCAGMTDDARRLLAVLATQPTSPPPRGYHRLALLLAPLVGDAALLPATGLTARERQLADASRAELAGDRARAAEILAALVADPSPSWDYAERAALLRNLRAVHRAADIAALCADSLRPAIFRDAFLPLRRACAP